MTSLNRTEWRVVILGMFPPPGTPDGAPVPLDDLMVDTEPRRICKDGNREVSPFSAPDWTSQELDFCYHPDDEATMLEAFELGYTHVSYWLQVKLAGEWSNVKSLVPMASPDNSVEIIVG